MGHSSGTLLRDILLGHSCGNIVVQLVDTLEGILAGDSVVADTLVGDAVAGRPCRRHSCGKLLWDTCVTLSFLAQFCAQSCGAPLLEIPIVRGNADFLLVSHSATQDPELLSG